MLALFSLVLLADWSTIIWKIWPVHPWTAPFLVVFVIFMSFGVVNVMIGIVVDSTNKASAKAEMEDRDKQMKQKLEKIQELASLMDQLDQDHNGELSCSEIADALHCDEFANLLAELNLPMGITSTDLVFLLAGDSQTSLSRTRFIDGIYRLLNQDAVQQDILIQLSLNQIKDIIRYVKEDVTSSMETGFQSIQDQLTKLTWQVCYASPRADLRCESVFTQKDSACVSLPEKTHTKLETNLHVDRSQGPGPESPHAVMMQCADDIQQGRDVKKDKKRAKKASKVSRAKPEKESARSDCKSVFTDSGHQRVLDKAITLYPEDGCLGVCNDFVVQVEDPGLQIANEHGQLSLSENLDCKKQRASRKSGRCSIDGFSGQ